MNEAALRSWLNALRREFVVRMTKDAMPENYSHAGEDGERVSRSPFTATEASPSLE